MNLLCSNVVRAPDSWHGEDFAAIQLSHMMAFRAHHPDGAAARISQGLVVIPTDHATAAQRAKYVAYAEARRRAHGVAPGPGPTDVRRDLVGSAAQIAEQLYADPGFQQVREAVFALPFSFAADDYEQILTDIAGALGPALGGTLSRGRARSAGGRRASRSSSGSESAAARRCDALTPVAP